MSLPRELTTVTFLSKTLALILFVSLPFLGFYLGVWYQGAVTAPAVTTTRGSQDFTKSAGGTHLCQLDRFIEKMDDFLDSYTVKKGDTLLTIANEQLGSVSRAAELAEINSGRYSTLSIDKPFLEVGWNLLLPPKKPASTSGKISQINGAVSKIRSINPTVLEISNNLGSNYAALSFDSHTELPKDYAPKVGDCIRAVTDFKNGTVYSISLQ